MPSFRRFLIVVIGFVGVIALAVVVGLPFYVFPGVDAPGRTDVVYVIGPPTATRLAVA